MALNKVILLIYLISPVFFAEVCGVLESLYNNQVHLKGMNEFYPYEKFEDIRQGNKSEITSVSISNMEFNPEVLMKALKDCTQMENLELDNVAWKGAFKLKIDLPSLERVKIVRTNWRFADITTADEFLDFLFFTTKETKDISASVVIRGGLGGAFVFYFQTLNLVQIPYDLQQYFTYEILELEDTILDAGRFNGTGVRKLEMINTKLVNGTASDILRRLTNISEIKMEKVLENKGRPTVDIALLPAAAQLKKLFLLDASLHNSQSSVPVKLESLDDLHLENVELSPDSISLSSEIRYITIKNTTSGFDYSPITSLASATLGGIMGKKQVFDLASLYNSREVIWLLSLENFHLVSTKHFQFTKLSTLYFTRCSLDPTLTTELSTIFSKVSSVNLEHGINDPTLKAFLNTSVDSISIKGVNSIGRENAFVLKFLEDLNAPPETDNIMISKNENGTWTNHAAQERSKRTRKENTVFYLYWCTLFIICLLGIVGNFFSILVLSRKNMWSSSSCLLIALAFFDVVVLTTLLGSLTLYGFKLVSLFLSLFQFPLGIYDAGSRIALLGNDAVDTVKLLEDLQAKFIYPLSKTAHTGSVYMTVLLTFERFMAVCHPLKVRFWTSTRKAIASSFLVLLLGTLLNLPRWFETAGSTIEVNLRRDPKHVYLVRLILERVYNEPNILQHRYYRHYYHGWVWTVIMYLIPIPLLTYLNTSIWQQIRNSNTRRREMSNSPSQNETVSLTIMLLCLSSLFVLCNAINGCIIWTFVSYGSYDPRDIEVISCIPVIINSSINFIIYCILGKKFRRELLRLFRKCPGCKKLGSLTTETQDSAYTSHMSSVRSNHPSTSTRRKGSRDLTKL